MGSVGKRKGVWVEYEIDIEWSDGDKTNVPAEDLKDALYQIEQEAKRAAEEYPTYEGKPIMQVVTLYYVGG